MQTRYVDEGRKLGMQAKDAQEGRRLWIWTKEQWSTRGRSIRPQPKFFTICTSALAAEVLF